MQPTIRRPAVAGSWYPGSASAIVAEIEGYLGGAGASAPEGRLVGLVSPHAGLRYSGPVAACGYSLLRGRSGLTVVLVGPSHHYAFKGAALWSRGAFETPLGTAPIDEDLAAALMAADAEWIVEGPRAHQDEHSLEMQLPFLQHLVADLQLVPCLMGSQSRAEVDALATALAQAVPTARRPVLLVASSDLSHYHPAPVANRMDALVVDDVARLDSERLMARLEESHEHACGGGPIVAVMKAARALGASCAAVLRYADSGDAGERDKSRVVGYVSAALLAA
ncbi:MAG TPA: AmmeMemoRadiSam system protein B [Vicinamibacteria bacterium]|nr:AmmeMemoRadiSam system protein B [Vicinamibacteria bacterium]